MCADKVDSGHHDGGARDGRAVSARAALFDEGRAQQCTCWDHDRDGWVWIDDRGWIVGLRAVSNMGLDSSRTSWLTFWFLPLGGYPLLAGHRAVVPVWLGACHHRRGLF